VMRARSKLALFALAMLLAAMVDGQQTPRCPTFPIDVIPGCANGPHSPALAPLLSAIADRSLLGPNGAIEIYSKLSANDQQNARACLRTAAAQEADYIMKLYLQGDELDVVALSGCASELYQETDRIARIGDPSLQDDFWLARADFFKAWRLLFTEPNRATDALKLLQESIRLSPDDVYHWNATGIAYLQERKYGCAQAAFEKAIRGANKTPCGEDMFTPGNNTADDNRVGRGKKELWIYPRTNLALVEIEKGNYGEARAAYEELIKESAAAGKRFGYLDYNLALLLQHLGDNKSARDEYRKALTDFSERASNAQAVGDQDLAQEFQRRQAEVHNALGTVASSTGRFADAETQYLKALQFNPTLSTAQYNLGLLYRRRGRSAEAIASWQKTVAADPRFLPAHLALARELARTRATQEAISHYQAVLAEAPTYEEALIGLGDQLAALQRVDEACRQYRAAAGGTDLSRLSRSRRTLCTKKAASTGVEPGAGIP